MPDVQLNGIEFAIKSDTTSAVVSIDRLRQALSKLQKIHINDLGLKSASREIRRFANSIGSIQTQKLDALSKSLRGLSSFGNAFSKIGENPEKLSTGLATMTVYLREISTIDFTNLKTAAESINQIAASANKIGRQAADSTRETGKGIKFVANEAKKASSPLSNFVASLKRIAFYRILRGIIKSITQAFQEGLKNAYEFSKATGDQAGLAAALDLLATKSQTMKNQLGAAFGHLLTAITPIVVQIIQLVTKLAEAISRLFAMLGGSDYYLRAKDVWTEWGEAAAGAGGAAKKALEYLAPFDELNVLPDPKSGGGGGGSNTDVSDMFDYVSIGEQSGLGELLGGWMDKIREFFTTTDWKDVADKIWSGLKEAFSDEGAATETIEMLFANLGAVTGASSHLAFELGRNIAIDIFDAVKTNVHDYNGDGKISIKELLDGLFLTSVLAGSVVREWLREHITDPFFDEFAKAWGLEGKEALFDAVVNFGIDIANAFIRDVINPLKEKWNEFADWVYEKTGGRADWRVEMTAEIAHVDSSKLKADQLKLKTIAALATVLDNIPDSKKKVDATARFNNRERTQYFKDNYQTFDAKARFYTRERTQKFKDDYQTFDATANFYTRTRTQKFKDTWQVFDAIANFYKRTTTKKFEEECQVFDVTADFSKRTETKKFRDEYQVFDATANFYTRTRTQKFKDTYQNFDATADFNSGKNNLTSDQTTFGSTADFKSRLVNISTAFDSSAKINGYTIDNNVKYNDYLYVGAVLDIKGQANTPTVAVNASYTNQFKARGGAFYGGSWHDIPQYAGGTANAHGSLFVAGEAGPEIVGHIGGRTEVLNQSQIAASIAAGVHRTLGAVGVTASGGYNLSDGSNEDVLYRAFKRALDETDFGGDVELDGDTIYRAMVRRNRANTRVTGVNAMA